MRETRVRKAGDEEKEEEESVEEQDGLVKSRIKSREI